MMTEGVSGYDIPTMATSPDRSQGIQHDKPMRLWHRITLAPIVALSIFLNFFQLQAGVPYDLYYTVAVHSMLLNWKNFFFLSYDPNGFVTIDKPPLDFWLQAASVRLFGFSTWSLYFPQALAGVLAVIILFFLVRRLCGPEAGLLAALVMTTTPVCVWMSRINYVDMMVVLIVLLAAWTLHRAIETGKRYWLLLAAILVGLGFNTKMAYAYLVMPAFGLFYLLGSPRHWRVRLIDLALALSVLLVVSLAWIVAVDLTPADQRPYVSHSQTNSELQLALGYNGFSNLAIYGNQHQIGNSQNQTQFLQQRRLTLGGDQGLFRLFSRAMGGYIAWLLPLGMIGLLSLTWRSHICLPLNPWQQAAIFWGMWFVTIYVVLSVPYTLQDYYTVMLAPAIAALTGCGLISMWQDYRERPLSDCRSWALPVALALTAIVQVYLLSLFPGWRNWRSWLSPLVLGLSLIAVLLLVAIRLLQGWLQRTHIQQQYSLELIHGSLIRLQKGLLQTWAWQRGLLITTTLTLLLIPLIWSSVVTFSMTKDGIGGNLPDGPTTSYVSFTPLFGKQKSEAISALSDNQRKLVSYLQAHQSHTRFLVAMISVYPTWWSSSVMLATDKPVMALGGFKGTDPILTISHLKDLVANGTIRFFWLPAIYKFHIHKLGTSSHSQTLLPGSRTVLRQYGRNSELIKWVNNHCRPVPASKGNTKPFASYNSKEGLSDQLFDCSHTS